jgi:hypothetical protein
MHAMIFDTSLPAMGLMGFVELVRQDLSFGLALKEAQRCTRVFQLRFLENPELLH